MTQNLPAVQEQRRYEMNEIQYMANAIALSGLFGIKTEAQAFALMLIADAEGLHPATVAQDYDIIQGRPARKSHSVLSRLQAAGGTVEWHELTSTRAEATFTHPRGGKVRIDWTIEMAQNAKLAGKDNWKAYPRAMLRARCITEGVRAVYPAALGGALMVEEAQDLDFIDAEPVTQAPAPAPASRVGRKPKAEAPPPEEKKMGMVEEVQAAAATQSDPGPGASDRQEEEREEEAPPPAKAQAPAPAPAQQEPLIEPGQIAYLKNKARNVDADLAQVLAEAGGLVLEKLTKSDFEMIKRKLTEMDT